MAAVRTSPGRHIPQYRCLKHRSVVGAIPILLQTIGYFLITMFLDAFTIYNAEVAEQALQTAARPPSPG